jgi:hypothetical protein
MVSSKAMITMFWGIRGMMLVNWLPQGTFSNGIYFNQEIFLLLTAKIQ